MEMVSYKYQNKDFILLKDYTHHDVEGGHMIITADFHMKWVELTQILKQDSYAKLDSATFNTTVHNSAHFCWCLPELKASTRTGNKFGRLWLIRFTGRSCEDSRL